MFEVLDLLARFDLECEEICFARNRVVPSALLAAREVFWLLGRLPRDSRSHKSNRYPFPSRI